MPRSSVLTTPKESRAQSSKVLPAPDDKQGITELITTQATKGNIVHVTAKLHTMRKAQEFSCMPMSSGEIMIQSDKSIGVYNRETGKGRLCVKGSYFHSLALYGFKFDFPEDFRAQVAEVLPDPNGETSLGGGAVIMKNTVTVVGGGKFLTDGE